MKIRDKYTCPLELIFDMIAGKWKCIIIWRLRLGKQSLAVFQSIGKKYLKAEGNVIEL